MDISVEVKVKSTVRPEGTLDKSQHCQEIQELKLIIKERKVNVTNMIYFMLVLHSTISQF